MRRATHLAPTRTADLSWEESVRLDLHDVEHWSLGLDAHVLWRTAFVVLGRHGAY